MQKFINIMNNISVKKIVYLYTTMFFLHIINTKPSKKRGCELLYENEKYTPSLQTLSVLDGENEIYSPFISISSDEASVKKMKRSNNSKNALIKYNETYDELKQKILNYYFLDNNTELKKTTKPYSLKKMDSSAPRNYVETDQSNNLVKRENSDEYGSIFIESIRKESVEISEDMENQEKVIYFEKNDTSIQNPLTLIIDIQNSDAFNQNNIFQDENKQSIQNIYLTQEIAPIKEEFVLKYNDIISMGQYELDSVILTENTVVIKTEENDADELSILEYEEGHRKSDDKNNISSDREEAGTKISPAKKVDSILTVIGTVSYGLFDIEKQNLLRYIKKVNHTQCNLISYYTNRDDFIIEGERYDSIFQTFIENRKFNLEELFDAIILEKDTLFIIYQPFYMVLTQISKFCKNIIGVRKNIERILVYAVFLDTILKELKIRINNKHKKNPILIDSIEKEAYYVNKTKDINTLTFYILYEINLIRDNSIPKLTNNIIKELNKISGIVLTSNDKKSMYLFNNTFDNKLFINENLADLAIWLSGMFRKLKKIVRSILKRSRAINQRNINYKNAFIDRIKVSILSSISSFTKEKRKMFVSSYSSIFNDGLHVNYRATKLFFMLFISIDFKEMVTNITKNKLNIFINNFVYRENNDCNNVIECFKRLHIYTNILYLSVYLYNNYEMADYGKEFWCRLFYILETIIHDNVNSESVTVQSNLKISDVVLLFDFFLNIFDFQVYILPLEEINIIFIFKQENDCK